MRGKHILFTLSALIVIISSVMIGKNLTQNKQRDMNCIPEYMIRPEIAQSFEYKNMLGTPTDLDEEKTQPEVIVLIEQKMMLYRLERTHDFQMVSIKDTMIPIPEKGKYRKWGNICSTQLYPDKKKILFGCSDGYYDFDVKTKKFTIAKVLFPI